MGMDKQIELNQFFRERISLGVSGTEFPTLWLARRHVTQRSKPAQKKKEPIHLLAPFCFFVFKLGRSSRPCGSHPALWLTWPTENQDGVPDPLAHTETENPNPWPNYARFDLTLTILLDFVIVSSLMRSISAPRPASFSVKL